MCRWNLNPSECSFPHSLGPIENPTSGTKLMQIPCFMLWDICVMLWSVIMFCGWTRVDCINPTLHLATAASTLDLCPFALSSY